jgi:hypothetical protein
MVQQNKLRGMTQMYQTGLKNKIAEQKAKLAQYGTPPQTGQLVTPT